MFVAFLAVLAGVFFSASEGGVTVTSSNNSSIPSSQTGSLTDLLHLVGWGFFWLAGAALFLAASAVLFARSVLRQFDQPGDGGRPAGRTPAMLTPAPGRSHRR